jgi:hypothetical protein
MHRQGIAFILAGWQIREDVLRLVETGNWRDRRGRRLQQGRRKGLRAYGRSSRSTSGACGDTDIEVGGDLAGDMQHADGLA